MMRAQGSDSGGAMQAYHERQRFAVWVYLIAAGAALGSLGALALAQVHGDKAAPPAVVVFSVAMLLFLFDVLFLRTTVDAAGVYVRLGWPVPIFWKQIDARRIRSARVVTYRPLIDAGGWGLRFGRFEGRFTVFWNARGNRGVLIDTDTRRYIVGSQGPERLCEAVRSARGV